MKEAYAWWSTQFIDGLRAKFNDQPRDDEGKRTIVILAVQVEGTLPQPNEIIYFEIPEALGRIQSFKAEVHIFSETAALAIRRAREAGSGHCIFVVSGNGSGGRARRR
jgi:hypothetical protein